MSEPEDLPTVQAALSAVKRAIGAVGKTGRNTEQNYNFRGVDAVVNAAAPHLNEAGVVVAPHVKNLTDERYETKRGAKMRNVTVEVEYVFTGPRGDTITASVYGESADAGDKAVAKAMSVAYRIALLQVLNLPTDDPDPDSTAHERSTAADRPPQVAPEAEALGKRYDALPAAARKKIDQWIAKNNDGEAVAVRDLPDGWWEQLDGILTRAEGSSQTAQEPADGPQAPSEPQPPTETAQEPPPAPEGQQGEDPPPPPAAVRDAEAAASDPGGFEEPDRDSYIDAIQKMAPLLDMTALYDAIDDAGVIMPFGHAANPDDLAVLSDGNVKQVWEICRDLTAEAMKEPT